LICNDKIEFPKSRQLMINSKRWNRTLFYEARSFFLTSIKPAILQKHAVMDGKIKVIKIKFA